MERALVTRLYRDEVSQNSIMLMEDTESKERIKVTSLSESQHPSAGGPWSQRPLSTLWDVLTMCR